MLLCGSNAHWSQQFSTSMWGPCCYIITRFSAPSKSAGIIAWFCPVCVCVCVCVCIHWVAQNWAAIGELWLYLGGFAKISKSDLFALSCPSGLPLDDFHSSLIFEYLSKIYLDNSGLIDIWREWLTWRPMQIYKKKKISLNSSCNDKCLRKKLYRKKTRISCLVHFSSKIMSLWEDLEI